MKIPNRKKNARAEFWLKGRPAVLVSPPISLAELAQIIQAGQASGMRGALSKAAELGTL